MRIFFLQAAAAMVGASVLPVMTDVPQAWFEDGARMVARAMRTVPNIRKARNVILFVGDGMGISTVMAARIFAGQLHGRKGEEY